MVWFDRIWSEIMEIWQIFPTVFFGSLEWWRRSSFYPDPSRGISELGSPRDRREEENMITMITVSSLDSVETMYAVSVKSSLHEKLVSNAMIWSNLKRNHGNLADFSHCLFWESWVVTEVQFLPGSQQGSPSDPQRREEGKKKSLSDHCLVAAAGNVV